MLSAILTKIVPQASRKTPQSQELVEKIRYKEMGTYNNGGPKGIKDKIAVIIPNKIGAGAPTIKKPMPARIPCVKEVKRTFTNGDLVCVAERGLLQGALRQVAKGG